MTLCDLAIQAFRAAQLLWDTFMTPEIAQV